jgi:SAM-dependent methyltransferase
VTSREERLRTSWDANATAWTEAVRGGHIPSRRAGTDEAIVNACRRLRPHRVLDVGCGEGWLARALSPHVETVVGIDASSELVKLARAAGGADYEVASYDQVVRDARVVPGPWDVIVCNFALLDDRPGPLLGALRSRLAPEGRILIQTVHPQNVPDAALGAGWREETFDSFGVLFPAAMPWYFRRLDDWLGEFTTVGLALLRTEEPSPAGTPNPLSLLLEVAVAREQKVLPSAHTGS